MLNKNHTANNCINSQNTYFKDSSFTFENRIIFDQTPLSPEQIHENTEVMNAGLNSSYDIFEESMTDLTNRSTENPDTPFINHTITADLTLFAHLELSLFEKNISGTPQLAAEFTDALSDNEAFIQAFGPEALQSPTTFFTNIVIENNTLYLIGGESAFSINLNNLRSNNYLENNESYEIETDGVYSETADELSNLQSIMETPSDSEPSPPRETIETTTNYRSLGDMLASGVENLGQYTYKVDLNEQDSNLIIRDEDGEAISRLHQNDDVNIVIPIVVKNFNNREGRFGNTDYVQIDAEGEQFVHADYLIAPVISAETPPQATDQDNTPESSETTDASAPEVTTQSNNPGTSTGDEGITESSDTEITTASPPQSSEDDAETSLFAGLSSLSSATHASLGNLGQLGAEAISSSNTTPSPTSDESTETPEAGTSTSEVITQEQAPENQAETTIVLERSREFGVNYGLIRSASENMEFYSNFALPEDMQTRHLDTRRRFRSAIISNRIQNTDLLSGYMSDLGINLDELTSFLHLTNHDNENEGEYAGRNLNASSLLALTNSEYANEEFSQFINRLQELGESGRSLTEEDIQELSSRMTTFLKLNQLIHFLTTMEYSEAPDNGEALPIEEAINIHPDSITHAELSTDFRNQLGRNFTFGRNHMKIASLYIQAFGPLSKLIEDGVVTIEGQGNHNNKFTIQINESNLNETQLDFFKNLVRDADFNAGADFNFATLTQAFDRFRNSDSYSTLQSRIANNRLDNLPTDASNRDKIFALLNTSFDPQFTGQFFRGRRHQSRTLADEVGGHDSVRARMESQSSSQISDLAIIQTIANRSSVNLVEGYAYPAIQFTSVMNHYIQLGRIAISTDLSLDEETRNAVAEASNIPADFLDNPRALSEIQVLAIRAGVNAEANEINMANENTENMDSLEVLFGETVTEDTRFLYESLLSQNPEINPEEAVELTRNVIQILAGLDASDPDNLSGGLGAGITLLNQDGDNYQFSINAGAGITSNRNIHLGLSLTYQRNLNEKNGWWLNGGTGASGNSFGFHLGTGLVHNYENGHYIAGTVGVFNGDPYAGVETGQSFESRIRVSLQFIS